MRTTPLARATAHLRMPRTGSQQARDTARRAAMSATRTADAGIEALKVAHGRPDMVEAMRLMTDAAQSLRWAVDVLEKQPK